MNYNEGRNYLIQLYSDNNIDNTTPQERYMVRPMADVCQLEIRLPGYKGIITHDYAMYWNGNKDSHPDMCEELYLRSRSNFDIYKELLEDIYINGTTITEERYSESISDVHSLIAKIFWITLQDELNYPQDNGYKGRRLPFCRYYEAICASSEREIQTIKERCNNHGRSTPPLFVSLPRISFYSE